MKAAALSVKQKFGYGLGDTASNIVFQMVANFMLIFYTDVFGITAAAAGTLLLVVRLFDGITDPVMGTIADRTRAKLGGYRPYLLYLAVPFGIFAVLAFYTPDWSYNYKLAYAYVTYGLLMTVYTAINIPYGALGGTMTTDPTERASLQSYRFAMAMFAMFLVVWAIPKLVVFFGEGSDQQGYPVAMLFMSVLAILCFVLCYFLTSEEKVQIEGEEKAKLSDFYLLLKNSQWTLVALISLFTLILIGVRSSVAPHYIKYYLEQPDLISSFLTVAAIGSVLGAVSTHLLTKRIQKISLFKVALIVIIISHILFFFVPPSSVAVIFSLFFVANFAHMIITPLMFSMVADTIDFGEKISGKKLTAIAFSGHLLAIKLGFAIGGAIAGWLLSLFGYIANQPQTVEALHGILIAFAGIPILCTAAAFIFITRYRLSETAVIDIQHSLSK